MGIEILIETNNPIFMAKANAKKRGPKDRSYVNKSEDHEVKYEPNRKTPAKEFGDQEKEKEK